MCINIYVCVSEKKCLKVGREEKEEVQREEVKMEGKKI